MSLLSGIMENPLIIVAAAIGVVGVGIIVWMNKKDSNPFVQSSGGKKSIIVFSPKDKRAKEIRIKEETETRLDCGKVGTVDIRYYKTGPGWNFPGGVTKFVGIDGVGYTAVIVDDKPRQLKLPQALQILWGQEAYDKMPKALKDPLERHTFGVTITPESVPDEDKNLKINAEDRDKENIKTGMEELRKNMKNKHKLDWMTLLQGAAMGIVVGILLVSFKVIKLA